MSQEPKSTNLKLNKKTIPSLLKKYKSGEKISMVTAYDATLARIVDDSDMDMILVGDSLGMVIQGQKNTLDVSIEDMIYHTRAVSRAVQSSHIMADMPFLSYQVSHEEAVDNAGQLLKAGAESVKIEGGEEMGDLVWYLKKIGIPVMGHIGLRPQQIHNMGGYKTQGKSKEEAEEILSDAIAFEDAGAFGLLLEGIPLELAQKITEKVNIPTIGIGSGPHCSGQVLVIYDLLGADPSFKPRFVKSYANLYSMASKALRSYISDVKKGNFPEEGHSVKRKLHLVEKDEAKNEKAIVRTLKKKKSSKKTKK